MAAAAPTGSRRRVPTPAWTLLITWLLWVPLAACQVGRAPGSGTPEATRSTSTTEAQGADDINVELDVFSGRANPTWTLTGAAAAEFLERLAALPAAAPFRPAHPLGYRGFVTRWSRRGSSCSAVVQGGRVQVTCGKRTTYHTDSRRAIEGWLLDTGRRILDPTTLAAVESARSAP